MLHRVRVYNPAPIAAKCMTGAPGKIAIGRDDGSIEVWSTRHSLFCIAQFDSPYKCVEALAFAESVHEKGQLALFSTGIDGRIVRYNGQGNVEETLVISGSPVWCLQASPSGKKLAAGSEDGYVHIIDTTHDVMISTKRLQQKIIGRILSCNWFPCEQKLVTGSLDSVKIWDVEKERAIESMTLSRVFRKDAAFVFSVVVVEEGRTVVSGDSFGRIIVWDANSGSQIQNLKLHSADVLVLHAFGDEVFASGVDPIIFRLYRSEGRWLHEKITQTHTHDIRALWRQDDRLFSAGVDAQLGVVHLASANMHFQRLLPPSFARNVQCHDSLLLLNYGTHLELWTTQPAEKLKLLVKLRAACTSPFRVVHICRTSFAVATSTKLMVYKVSLSKDNRLENCEKVYSTELADDAAAVQSMTFAPSGRRMFVTLQDGRVMVVNVVEEIVETKARIVGAPVTCAAVGPQLVAFGDSQGNVTLYDHDMRLKCGLPRHSSAVPLALRFESDRLYVAYDDLMFFEFCTKAERYAAWSEHCLKDQSFEARISQIRRGMLSSDGVRDLVVMPTNDVLLGFEAKVCLARKSLLPADCKQGIVVCPDFFNAVRLWRHDDDVAVCEISGNQIASSLPPILKKKRFV
ncbi:cirhin-like [Tropilaelaps mercedesae]|uniref:Cirhin-like n=1 Tax=Tropilaelaps mercedesae TaxID=418985 RepID=A0A1V9Y1H5_9ACAR|nr:cirhin-like [Tropilaelaps mercedesae]